MLFTETLHMYLHTLLEKYDVSEQFLGSVIPGYLEYVQHTGGIRENPQNVPFPII